jgi:hypothetical protein
MSDLHLNNALIKTLSHSTLVVIAADLETQWESIPSKFKHCEESVDLANKIIRLLGRATRICDQPLIRAGYYKRLANIYLTLNVSGKDVGWVSEMECAINEYLSVEMYSYARDTAKDIIKSGREWPAGEMITNAINLRMRPFLTDY